MNDNKKENTGVSKVKEQSIFGKLLDAIKPEDGRSMMSLIWRDIIVPNGKKVISETVDSFLYKGDPRFKRSSNGGIKYNTISSNRFSSDMTGGGVYSGRKVDNYCFDSRGEAMDKLNELDSIIHSYGVAKVSDYKQILNISPEEIAWTDQKYGWTDIKNAEITRTFSGDWMIKLPKAVPIDDLK